MSWSTSTRRSRLPRDWQARRRTILRRDVFCRMCGYRPSTEVDHVRPGDDHTLANLQGLCHDCHEQKTIAERPLRATKNRKPEQHPGLNS